MLGLWMEEYSEGVMKVSNWGPPKGSKNTQSLMVVAGSHFLNLRPV